MSQIRIDIEGFSILQTEEGKTWREVLELANAMDSGSPVMGVLADNRVEALSEIVSRSCSASLIRLSDNEGFRIYRRTLIFLFTVCCHKLFPSPADVIISHSMGGNIYGEIKLGRETLQISQEELQMIKEKMQELIAQKAPVLKKAYPLESVLPFFEARRREDQKLLFHFRSEPLVNLYSLDGELDFFIGDLLPDAGCIDRFGLHSHQQGFLIQTPSKEPPHDLLEIKDSPKLFGTYQNSKEWGRLVGVANAGELNAAIAKGEMERLIQVSEALHAREISNMAEEISRSFREGKGEEKWLVLIAGPSSSGKTTSCKKLMIQLMAEGLVPKMISMDDYFIDRDKLPLEADGTPDFEALSAVDTDLFNADMARLMRRETIRLPRYNFHTGMREEGELLRLEEKEVLLVEGIHCINEEVSKAIPACNKFKIYISAMTMLSIDNHNRVHTSDTRLLRRMVRDYHRRGYSASDTLRVWAKVRRGEDRNIFPFQEEADVLFNSAHLYELSVLKTFAEPLLYQIDQQDPMYPEARRLLRFLSYFQAVDSTKVPRDSLIREFIGGGSFE